MCNEKPTEKQLLYIERICEELDIEFKGTTKEQAKNFISNNIEEFRKVPTQRQIDFINKIIPVVKIQFSGTTKEDAADYISKYKDEYLRKTMKSPRIMRFEDYDDYYEGYIGDDDFF